MYTYVHDCAQLFKVSFGLCTLRRAESLYIQILCELLYWYTMSAYYVSSQGACRHRCTGNPSGPCQHTSSDCVRGFSVHPYTSSPPSVE